MSAGKIPFRIAVPDAALAELRERLARTRFPDTLADVGNWEDGADTGYLRELVAHWKDRYDWRAAEAMLNRFAQFRLQVEDLNVHFIHERGKGPKPLPLLLMHGWPVSFWEFHKLIGLLTDPAAHGGDARDAFDVIVPSTPGTGFSDHPSRTGTGHRRVAALYAQLMRELGYERFYAAGGDWGNSIAIELGLDHPERLAGLYVTTVYGQPPKQPDEEERRILKLHKRWRDTEWGYVHMQGTKPQTLGQALNDSPAGLAAWIVEKFRTWSDCNGDIESRFSKDELLTNVSLYWFTESATSAARLYKERFRGGGFAPRGRVEAPTACAIYPREMARQPIPRSWVERVYNVQRWTDMPSGGHFPALEEPAALVQELRTFFRQFRE